MLPDRIKNKIRIMPNECHMWIASKNHKGYGQVWFEGKMRNAHRLIYSLSIGLIKEGLQLDHTCRNRWCVNPEHLEQVTNDINVHRGLRSKLDPIKVNEIRNLKGKMRITDIAKKYDVSRRAIQFVLNGETWI